jgi:uncharacterized cupin superfamily protein
MSVIARDTARIETTAASDPAGRSETVLLSDAGGLTGFGAFTETLWPGARSSLRHWHEAEDEFLLMLEGEAVLVEDTGEVVLRPGDACTFRAGHPVGHQIVNRSDRPCRYLVAGTRAPADTVHYTADDRLYRRLADGTVLRTRRDGSPLPEGH